MVWEAELTALGEGLGRRAEVRKSVDVGGWNVPGEWKKCARGSCRRSVRVGEGPRRAEKVGE